jgi:hypothetical protein
MKALTSIALILLLCSCQKEIMFPAEPEASVVKEQPPKEVIYKAEPNQQIVMSEFAPMLWDKKQYQITEYYCVKKDLWSDLPSWVKDDVYTFQEFGKGWVAANDIQNPLATFDVIQKTWQLYPTETDGVKLEWLNNNYDTLTYNLAAYTLEESFTLSAKVNDSKVFITYTLLKK